MDIRIIMAFGVLLLTIFIASLYFVRHSEMHERMRLLYSDDHSHTEESRRHRRFTITKISLLSATAVTILAMFILLIGYLSFGHSDSTTETKTKNISLVSMSNGVDITSENMTSFFGTFLTKIETQNTYRYYYDDNGYIRQENVPVDMSYIIYTNEPPYLEIERTALITEKTWWFINCKSKEWEEPKYIFHIPEGSIAGYNLR